MAAVVLGAVNLAGGRTLETSLVLGISLAVAAIRSRCRQSCPSPWRWPRSGWRPEAFCLVGSRPSRHWGRSRVLAADKTGTLTTGRMAVAQCWTPSGSDDCELREAAALCNDASVGKPGLRDDPTEVALVEAAGVDVAALRAANPRISDIPFDAVAATMTTTRAVAGGGQRIIRKGAPETVLRGSCDTAAAWQAAERLARAGQRVLAVAATATGGCSGWSD